MCVCVRRLLEQSILYMQIMLTPWGPFPLPSSLPHASSSFSVRKPLILAHAHTNLRLDFFVMGVAVRLESWWMQSEQKSGYDFQSFPNERLLSPSHVSFLLFGWRSGHQYRWTSTSSGPFRQLLVNGSVVDHCVFKILCYCCQTCISFRAYLTVC